MYTVERTTTASPARVWEVLADGWTYPLWVVGASRMRAVSPDWPAVGARLHHSVGTWPVVLDDETTITEIDPGVRLRLQPKARPFGRAVVEMRLHADGEGTRIEMSEDIATGPARLVPGALRAPAITARNEEALRRLVLLAERRARP